MNILELAKRNQQKAWEIIEDTRIVRIWEGIGAKVNLVGSLRTGYWFSYLYFSFGFVCQLSGDGWIGGKYVRKEDWIYEFITYSRSVYRVACMVSGYGGRTLANGYDSYPRRLSLWWLLWKGGGTHFCGIDRWNETGYPEIEIRNAWYGKNYGSGVLSSCDSGWCT